MNRWIISSSMNARLLIVAFSAAIIFYGASNLKEIPLGVYPEFSPIYVEVQTEALGLSADEVEQLITGPIEADLLNGVAWVKEIRSESMPGLSSVICIFEDGTDPMKARQVIAERLTQAHALPNVSKPPIMLQPYSSTSRIMKVGLSSTSPDLSLIDLSVLARWTIQPYLMGIEGVANVSIWGQRKRQLQVLVNPEVLAHRGVTLHEVIKTTGEALWVSPLTYLRSSTPGTGGFFDTPNQRLGVRHVLPIKTAQDLGNITVHGRKDILLGDITTVVENHQPLIGDAIVNGAPGLMLVVEKFPWASTMGVSDKVEKALDALEPGLAGVAMDTDIYEPTKFIEASYTNLKAGLGIGFGLAIILLVFLFYEWRAALISTVAICLSILAGMTILYLQGVIFDIMILAGFALALGVIIDDAITNVENVRKRLAENTAGKSTVSVILEACTEVRRPILFATVAMVLAIIPLYYIGGIPGSFLSPFISSYLLAVGVSLAVAITTTPALCVLLYTKPIEGDTKSRPIAALRRGFDKGIQQFMAKPNLAYATFFAVAAAGLIALPLLRGGTFLPSPNERNLVISLESAFGTSHPEMSRITQDMMKELATIPGIEKLAAHIGRAVLSDHISNVSYSEIWLGMTDDAAYEDTKRLIAGVVDGYPGLKTKVQTYRQQSLDECVATDKPMYAVRVYGEDNEIMAKKAEEVSQAIAAVEGISQVEVKYPEVEPTIEIQVDLEAAKKHQVKPGDVRRAAAILLSGVEVGSLFEGQKVFEIVVWGTPEIRSSISSVENLLVDKPTGGQVRLGDVAAVTVVPTPTVIDREAVSRYIDVSFDYAGTNKALEAAVYSSISNVRFPLEYHAKLIGQFTDKKEDKAQAWAVAVAGMIGIFLLFQVVFWSWRLAFLSYLSTTMAMAGGIIAVLLGGLPLSLGVAVGFLAIFGISLHQGIVLISHFRNLELNDENGLTKDLVLRGISDRFAPILMTTLLTLLVFLPIVIMGNVAGLEVIHPMSVVIFGGVITTTVLNLFVLPVLYYKFGKVSDAVVEEERAMLDLDMNLATY